jgi:hypothetical protein
MKLTRLLASVLITLGLLIGTAAASMMGMGNLPLTGIR